MERRSSVLAIAVVLWASLAWAQEGPSEVATSTTPQETRGPPYGKEDVPYLEKAVQEAKQTFDAALERWSQLAADAPNSPAQQAARTTLRETEADLERLNNELELARTAPARANVRLRLAYDAEVSAIQAIHERLSVRVVAAEDPSQAPRSLRTFRSGDRELILGRSAEQIAFAERELARLAEAQKTLEEGSKEPSYLRDRLSDLEKLDEQIRLEEEQLAFAKRIYDHLLNVVFEHYIEYEDEVVNAAAAYQRLSTLWPDLRGTPAVRYRTLADSPDTIARTWFLEGPEPKVPGIVELWSARAGILGEESPFNVRKHVDLLARFRLNINQHQFVRDRLLVEVEKLRALEAEKARPPAVEPSSQLPVNNGQSKYAQYGRRIEDTKARIEDLGQEKIRHDEERADLQIEYSKRKKEEGEARQEAKRLESDLEEVDRNGSFALPKDRARSPSRSRQIRAFVLSESIKAVQRRIQSIERAVRRVEIRRAVVNSRFRSANEERELLENKVLNRQRRQYYWALAATFAVRSLRVMVVVILALTVVRLIRRGSQSFIEGMIKTTIDLQGAEAIRQQRIRTLLSVFVGAARVFVYVLAFFFIIGQFDIDYGPLLVAAGGLSVAVGFGAQSLVRDFFAGFFILLEGQYSIGDVVELSGKAGVVEDMNLRTTVLRSLNGEVHTIPNGEITTTSNKTKNWARAVLDIGVAYEEDIDSVISVLSKIATDLHENEHWKDKVRATEVLGLDALGDSSIVVKVLLEVQPGQQWAVSREYLRRVKVKFDELDIEIPWPQRVVTQKIPISDAASMSKKRRSIRRFVGADIEPEAAPSPSVEERQRADVIAQKEASLIAAQLLPDEEAPATEGEAAPPDKKD